MKGLLQDGPLQAQVEPPEVDLFETGQPSHVVSLLLPPHRPTVVDV